MITAQTHDRVIWRHLLTVKRDELTKQIAAQRGQIVATDDPEDEAGAALQSYTTDILIAGLERDIRSLAEIELALHRLETGNFGICESCGEQIADARLKALPWVRLCVRCAQRANSVFVHSEP